MFKAVLGRSCLAHRTLVNTRAVIGARTFMAAAPARKARPVDAAAKVDLVDKFAFPAPPPVPEVEALVSETAVVEDAIEEEEWPAVYNPIDDPNNYPDEWEYRTEADKGTILPERLKPYDYHHH
ncbi:hypothetical protein BC829DRAFT_393312 [Chytridium lagenaria]|nr:hypothetical protein BC829DRAFT_393312 [Chytridium lagenaria]